MELSRVDAYITANADKFKGEVIPIIRDRLIEMPDNRYLALQSISLKNPTTILLIAIFLGWDRFFLDDIGLGIVKILTCYGFWIWWIIDIITATDRTKDYNFKRFMSLV